MNMEDRLREAFDQEAEHLHAPSGSPETAVRRGRRRRASNLIGGATLILALVGGTAAGVQLLGDTEDPPDQDLAASSEVQETDESASEGPLPSAGVVDFAWERIALPKPNSTNVWDTQVVAKDGGFIAVATGWDQQSGLQQLLTWNSADGLSWSLTSTELGGERTIDQVLATDDGFVAVTRTFDGSNETIGLLTSTDGATWTEGEIDLGPIASGQHVYFSGVTASGDGTTVVGGVIETEPVEPPVVLEAAGVVLEENGGQGTYTVTDLETGEVITEIEAHEIWGGSPAIYGPDGELLLVVPLEFLEDSVTADSGLAIMEQDGIRLEFDFEEFTYVATEVSSGNVLASGTQDELYRNPRLRIADPETGDLIVDMDMDQFFLAQEKAYSQGNEYFPESSSFVLVTDDGETWSRVDVAGNDSQQADVNGLVYGADGFVLTINRYGPEEATREVWRSTDGRDWEVSASDDFRNGQIVSRDGMYYSLSYDRRPGVFSSTDGANWTRIYETESGVYFQALGSGELGLVAVGQVEDTDLGPPLSVSKEGRTMTLDYVEGRLTVTDDEMDAVLRVIEFDIYDEDPPAGIEVDEDNFGLTILDTDGTPLMVLTEEDMEGAESEREIYEDYTGPTPALAYSPDGANWFTVSTAGLDVAYPRSVAVGEDAVVIVGEPSDQYSREFGSDGSVTQVLGDDGVSFSYSTATTLVVETEAPETFVWVGRPR